MTKKIKRVLALMVSIALFMGFGAALLIYVKPMEDVSLNLSLSLETDIIITNPSSYDPKGWTVYTQEGSTVTELEPDGFGGFTGLELGQTFYFSRVMEEELDSPTLQLGTVNRTFSVWLDDMLIYTDCPELDNRIGYLRLPMREWDRDDPVTITLPLNYQGKTLTIAQSFPEYTEANAVKAFPASVMLFCGYAYESSLISESFAVAILAAAAFLVGVILLIAFMRSLDFGLLSLSLVAFLWMVSQLTETSFFWKYFGTYDNSLFSTTQLISSGALLIFLATRAGKHRKILWWIIVAFILSVIGFAAVLLTYSAFYVSNWVTNLFSATLCYWIIFAGLVITLVMGALFWRKENWFYRVFTPIALAGVVVYWAAVILFVEKSIVWIQLTVSLQSGSIAYIYHRTLPAIMAAALFTAIAEAIKTEISRRTEKRLLEQRQELVQESYENMRRQHEEVMMIRHDMVRHFRSLQAMNGEEQIKMYLDDLIGQNQKIRPVVQTGNEMLDIILGGKLSAAKDAGISVEIKKAEAPSVLPLRDADLCSLVMNMMDNALTGAASSGASEPFIRLDIHVKSTYLAIICENSADIRQIEKQCKKETVPKHGLGLNIMAGITERYHGLMDTEYGTDYYKVRVAIPLHQSER